MERIALKDFHRLVEHLFLVKNLVFDEEYKSIIKTPEESVYFSLNKKFFPIFQKSFQISEEYVLLGLQVAKKNFLLFSSQKFNFQGAETFIKQEDESSKEIIKFLFSSIDKKTSSDSTLNSTFDFLQEYCQAIAVQKF